MVGKKLNPEARALGKKGVLLKLPDLRAFAVEVQGGLDTPEHPPADPWALPGGQLLPAVFCVCCGP